MNTRAFTQSIWVVAEVQSGIPVEVKAFSSQEKATGYLELLRENLNPENDEVGIFEIALPSD